jgi:hypothetical protein
MRLAAVVERLRQLRDEELHRSEDEELHRSEVEAPEPPAARDLAPKPPMRHTMQPMQQKGPEPVPAAENIVLTSDQLTSMIEQAAARLVANQARQPELEPAQPWQASWWTPGQGPTSRTWDVFVGAEAWLLAWFMHQRSGRQLAVIEERLPGARHQIWRTVHALVVAGPDLYLDIAGIRTEADLLNSFGTARHRRGRITALPRSITFDKYVALLSDDPVDWKVSEEVADYVASEVLTAHRIAQRS